jgi:hypothetical protein
MSTFTFKFELGDAVTITASGEKGTVIGRAEYQHALPCYYLRYVDSRGCARESWWYEDSIQKQE